MSFGLLISCYRGMQDCFRQHPEIYGSELEEEEVDRQLEEEVAEQRAKEASYPSKATPPSDEANKASGKSPVTASLDDTPQKQDGDELLVPKVWHDTSQSNRMVETPTKSQETEK